MTAQNNSHHDINVLEEKIKELRHALENAKATNNDSAVITITAELETKDNLLSIMNKLENLNIAMQSNFAPRQQYNIPLPPPYIMPPHFPHQYMNQGNYPQNQFPSQQPPNPLPLPPPQLQNLHPQQQQPIIETKPRAPEPVVPEPVNTEVTKVNDDLMALAESEFGARCTMLTKYYDIDTHKEGFKALLYLQYFIAKEYPLKELGKDSTFGNKIKFDTFEMLYCCIFAPSNNSTSNLRIKHELFHAVRKTVLDFIFANSAKIVTALEIIMSMHQQHPMDNEGLNDIFKLIPQKELNLNGKPLHINQANDNKKTFEDRKGITQSTIKMASTMMRALLGQFAIYSLICLKRHNYYDCATMSNELMIFIFKEDRWKHYCQKYHKQIQDDIQNNVKIKAERKLENKTKSKSKSTPSKPTVISNIPSKPTIISNMPSEPATTSSEISISSIPESDISSKDAR